MAIGIVANVPMNPSGGSAVLGAIGILSRIGKRRPTSTPMANFVFMNSVVVSHYRDDLVSRGSVQDAIRVRAEGVVASNDCERSIVFLNRLVQFVRPGRRIEFWRKWSSISSSKPGSR